MRERELCLFALEQNILSKALLLKSFFLPHWCPLEMLYLRQGHRLYKCFTKALQLTFSTCLSVAPVSKPTPAAPGVSRRSPILVLSKPKVAQLQCSNVNRCVQNGMASCCLKMLLSPKEETTLFGQNPLLMAHCIQIHLKIPLK